ncbi:MAG: MYXO-CTERM sorting domain-containing protein [Nannocystaceae bacterium]
MTADLPANLRARALAVIVPGLACSSLLLGGSPAQAGVTPPAVRPGTIMLQEGDAPGGGAQVSFVGPPFVNDAGEVGFVGALDDGDNFVFVGAGVVWLGTDEMMATLDALEIRMDSNGLGSWVYAVDIDGNDGLVTDAGVFAAAGDPAPGLSMGATYTFLGNPSMTDAGELFFVVGVDDSGDGQTDFLAFYSTPDGTPGAALPIFAGGDVVDMFTIDDNNSGIDFDYAVSSDGAHRINILNMEGPGGSDSFVRVDDAFVAREQDPTGDGDNWDDFGLVSINTAGNYVFTGDTDGGGGTDEFLAYNSTIVVREGDVVDGILLPEFATDVRFVAISNLDQAVHAWEYNTPMGPRQTVFFACDAADIPGSSQVVLTTIDDSLDVDGDDIGDFTIAGLTFDQPTVSRAIGETPFVYATVTLDDGMGQFEAVVELPVSCCGNAVVNPFEECDDGNSSDTDECLSTCVAASCGDGVIQDGVEECDDGNDDDTDECPSTCADATCGDGFVLEGTEDCDDGNDDDTDDCTSACVTASCGDGFVQDGVEDCDDGNTEDGDGCEADCTLPGTVDDTGGTGGTGGGTGVDTGNGPGPSSLSDTGGFDSSGTAGETDGGSGGIALDDDGCACRADRRGPAGAVWSLLGLGLLGLARRRRA